MKTKETNGEAVKAEETKPKAEARSVKSSDVVTRLSEETPLIEVCIDDVDTQVERVYNLVCDMRYASDEGRKALLGRLVEVSSSLVAAFRSLRSSVETVCLVGARCKDGGRQPGDERTARVVGLPDRTCSAGDRCNT